MANRERYKKLIMFFASVIIVAIETLIFAYIWYNFYLSREIIGRLFVRGNQVVIGFYVLMLYFFYKIYGGFKVGYLREYSCAMKSHFRKFGNQMSGSGNHLYNHASLLA